MRYFGLGLMFCAALAISASADIIIGNFSAAPGTGTAFGTGSTTQFKAGGWTMPAGQDYFLDSVTLTIDFQTGVGEGVVAIWSGAGQPQTQIATLTSPPQIGSGDFTFTPAAPLVMQAGETYWVHVSAPPTSPSFQWRGTSPSTAPSGLAANAGYIFNGNPSTFFNRYQVEGTVVPEPAALLLLTVGALFLRRR